MHKIELVGKIGSMALIDVENKRVDEARIKRLSSELRPGIVWVTSGATEIGRLDYMTRAGRELSGNYDEIKTDYASQGQSVLMGMYRDYIDPRYGVRQVLVEHHHFNDEQKRAHIKNLLVRAAAQDAVPIINYNDAVSFEENRKMEISALRQKTAADAGKGGAAAAGVVELVDNDETAAQIACLVGAPILLILTGVNGIYADPADEKSLIESIGGKNADELLKNIEAAQKNCAGASRKGANGARAKLEYIKAPALAGARVVIANAKYGIKDILAGNVPQTVISIR